MRAGKLKTRMGNTGPMNPKPWGRALVRLMAELNLLLLLAYLCSAQAADHAGAELRKLKIVRDGDKTKVELTLSKPVVPNVTTLNTPDRLVLDLPNTTVNSGQRHILVNLNGLLDVRVGLKTNNPPVTRTVLDLNTFHSYALATNGNTITLIVLPVNAASGVVTRGRGATPAANGLLIGKLLRGRTDSAGQQITTLRFSRSASGANGVDAKTKPSTPPSGENLLISFKVKYVAEGAAYLKGGRSSGLSAGMKLVVRDPGPSSGDSASPHGPVVAELQIVSAAETSAVAEIRNARRDVKPGDWADLSPGDSAGLEQQQSISAAVKNAAPALTVGNATGADPHPEAAPEESRIRARLGFDYSGISSGGSTPGRSTTVGMALQTDMTRIAGTHWNLQGYWRGRLTNSSQPNEDTLQDYLDRTYTIRLYYDNPDSKWVAGFGRLYLPWAVSLDTIDGGYVGRKIAKGIIAGVFLGSTPDPTSWHYSPDQQIGGSFVNFEGGSYDDFHYTSTLGIALSLLKWQLDRPYLFVENGLTYMKYFSIYHSLIVDSPQGISTDGIKPGTGISRSYFSLRVQPIRWVSFDVSHNYFRDVPTAATALIGTGLVDKLLYQGISLGGRVEPVKHFALYATLGRSDKTGDAKQSLNQMYGLTWSEIWRTGLRADIHYSKFDSSFAQGNYQVLSLSRHIGNRINWDAQVGHQSLESTFTVNHRSMFVDTSFDANLGSHAYLQSGYTIERGAQLNYNQWYLSLGYRLNVKGPAK
jgi:hypothetical protein